MNCRRARRANLDADQGALGERAGRAHARHLARCEACRADAARVARGWRALAHLDAPPPTPALWPAVAATLDSGAGQRWPVDWVPAWQRAAVAGFVALGVALGVLAFERLDGRDRPVSEACRERVLAELPAESPARAALSLLTRPEERRGGPGGESTP